MGRLVLVTGGCPEWEEPLRGAAGGGGGCARGVRGDDGGAG